MKKYSYKVFNLIYWLLFNFRNLWVVNERPFQHRLDATKRYCGKCPTLSSGLANNCKMFSTLPGIRSLHRCSYDLSVALTSIFKKDVFSIKICHRDVTTERKSSFCVIMWFFLSNQYRIPYAGVNECIFIVHVGNEFIYTFFVSSLHTLCFSP